MKTKLTVFFVLIVFIGYCQEYIHSIAPNFQKLDLKDGLSNLNVSSIIQDDLGYIWIATARGVNRYDGTSFKHYFFEADKNMLFHNWVTKLYKNQEGKIFISTRYGLNLLDPEQDKMDRISSSKEFFLDFVEFDDNTYAVSDLQGLCLFNKQKQAFEYISELSKNKLLNRLITDDQTGIWAKTLENLSTIVAPLTTPLPQNADNDSSQTSALLNYNPKTNSFKSYPIPNSAKNSYDGPMIKVDSLLLISGTRFLVFNLHKSEFISLPKEWSNLNQLKNNRIVFIKQLNKHILYIGTQDEGLFVFNLKTHSLRNFNKFNSTLASNWATCICKDRDNNIWLGTFDHGVNIAFNGQENINYDNALNKLTSDKFITSITSDNNQNYYIGTRYYGFYIFNAQTKNIQHFHDENSFLTSNHIRTIYIDSENKIWLATENTLHTVDKNIQNLRAFEIPEINQGIVSITEQSNRIVASSDAQGIFIFELDGTPVKHITELGSNVSQVIRLSQHEIIASSFDHGIYKYDLESGAFEKIYQPSNKNESNVNQPITMHLDTDSILWIGNYVSGLHKFNLKTKKAKVFTIKDGLPDNDIVGILEDRKGYLWLSTSYGLSRFDKKYEFVNYFYNEGLENLQFHAKAAHIDGKGHVFLGGSNGLSYFNPEVLNNFDYKNKPKIILQSLAVQNKEIRPNDKTKLLSKVLNNTQEITLNHKQKVFTIEYHAFDYIAANNIRYSYFLEGFDTEWNNVGERDFANFSNLNAGTYTFKVKAQNNSGAWSDIASLEIRIKPSPFNTILAYCIYILVIAFIVYISFKLTLNAKLYKSRLESEHKERLRENEVSQMKMRFFTNISHEIRTPLTLIKGNTDLLSKDLHSKQIQLDSFKGLQHSTNRLLALVNQLLSFRSLENDALDLKIKNDDLISITQKLIQSFKYVAANRNISIEINTEYEKLILPIDEDKYEKIISNLLSNSLKHAKENGNIIIQVTPLELTEYSMYFNNTRQLSESSYVKISVADNGSGIPKEELPKIFNRFKQSKADKNKPDYSGTGIGLNFTKRLVELHRGAIIAKSKPNIETKFSFVLSLDSNIYKNDIWINEKSVLKSDILYDETKLEKEVAENGKSPLILVVEDDLELNRFISSSLKNTLRVISCYNGKEGLKLAQNQLPDIIISDIMMPEVDGLELCKLVRNDKLISHIPIILLTAITDEESEITGLKYGADDYISKPFNLSVLKARINNLIALRKKLQQSYKQGILEEPEKIITNQFELNFIKKVDAIVTVEYQSPKLNVNSLAKQMHMSRTNFYRKFVNIMDISPKDFITKYRINKAIELIKNGEDNFGEISFLCGFGSQSNFSVLFKKEKGLTPIQFKKSL